MATTAKRRTAGMLETKIAGIPCLIDVHHCDVVEGSYSYNAASDWDYHGYTECDYTVCDRKGYKADWLMKKMTPEDCARIEDEIIRSYED